MPQFFLNKRLIIVLVSFIVLVALVGYSLKDRKELTWTEEFMKDTAGFVQLVVNKPVSGVRSFMANIEAIRNTFEENRLLKSRLDEYAQLETELAELRRENKELKLLVNKRESLRDFKTIEATVIARNPDQWHENLVINRGKTDGVKRNMAVITTQGLIGKVKQVSRLTATIQLLSSMDTKNRISAYVQGEKNAYGLIEGFDKERNTLILRRIPFQAKVEKKQKVLTSGLGGIFPRGLLVGEVQEVMPDENGLTLKAYLKPAADFYDVNDVMIVMRNMVAEQDEEE